MTINFHLETLLRTRDGEIVNQSFTPITDKQAYEAILAWLDSPVSTESWVETQCPVFGQCDDNNMQRIDDSNWNIFHLLQVWYGK